MSALSHHLAFDLGAESGRAMLGILAEDRLALQEVHRFPNPARLVQGRLQWDPLHLFGELTTGWKAAVAAAPEPLASAGIDTWGVDFGLIDRRGDLIGNPVHYRDARTNGVFERAFEIVPKAEIFERTGIQFLQFNTILQLLAMRLERSPQLEIAERLMMMPDLLAYWLTGKAGMEYTIATTTQAYDPRARDWAWPLIKAFDLPERIFPSIDPAGSILGELKPDLAAELGVRSAPVVLPASHDTGSAVVAVPATGGSWAYISCGTWALIGAEAMAPVITPDALRFNFTNEGGAFGTNRLLTNVMGLWLLQQSRKSWARAGREFSYEDLAAAAARAPAFAAWVDPDDPAFFDPPDMVEAISGFCRRTGQTPPESPGAVARCVIESLALKYRMKIGQIEKLTGRPVEVVHIVGGGCRNAALCQATASACGRLVLAGPAEATAMGNALVQAAAIGRLKGLEEVRAVVRASATPVAYEPVEADLWEAPYARFAAHFKDEG